ncbi:MAG: hypothetical protein M1825_001783 [Sarcosagium campestre]|nr:MAG: hypothetical protein M1825_001783 [Sarcosagium campestre]
MFTTIVRPATPSLGSVPTLLLSLLLVLLCISRPAHCKSQAEKDREASPSYTQSAIASGPPPAGQAPRPGWPSLDASKFACFSHKGGTWCLANGVYTLHESNWRVFDEGLIDTLRLPKGASVKFPGSSSNFVFTEDQSASDTGQSRQLNLAFNDALTTRPDNATVEVAGLNDEPCVCLFSLMFYRGYSYCFAPGSGYVPAPFLDNVMSIQTHGHASLSGLWDWGNGSTTMVVYDSAQEDLSAPLQGPTDKGSYGSQRLTRFTVSSPIPVDTSRKSRRRVVRSMRAR